MTLKNYRIYFVSCINWRNLGFPFQWLIIRRKAAVEGKDIENLVYPFV